jgi:hypothetical protein
MTDQHEKRGGMSPVNESRRRLTKAGLAVPAVLGTLASRPVLAAVPWKCTISGQVSGNMSGHAMETCVNLGQTQTYWAGEFDQGDDKNILISDSDWFPNLTTNYIFRQGNDLTFDTTPQVASIYDILSATNLGTELRYAQRALVLLLNAKGHLDTSSYPLKQSQAERLYVAAATQSSFSDTNPDFTWTNGEVMNYIDLLWRA